MLNSSNFGSKAAFSWPCHLNQLKLRFADRESPEAFRHIAAMPLEE